VLDSRGSPTAELGRAVMRASDFPLSISGDMFRLAFTGSSRPVREESTVALSGESADEIFGGYTWFHAEGDRGRDVSLARDDRQDFDGTQVSMPISCAS